MSGPGWEFVAQEGVEWRRTRAGSRGSDGIIWYLSDWDDGKDGRRAARAALAALAALACPGRKQWEMGEWVGTGQTGTVGSALVQDSTYGKYGTVVVRY